jgi:hypothetical protein
LDGSAVAMFQQQNQPQDGIPEPEFFCRKCHLGRFQLALVRLGLHILRAVTRAGLVLLWMAVFRPYVWFYTPAPGGFNARLAFWDCKYRAASIEQ